MRKLILPFLFITISNFVLAQSDCLEKPYPAPALADSVKKVFEANFRSAEKKYKADSSNDEHIIWYGRRLAYLGKYKEAIGIYSRGIVDAFGHSGYSRVSWWNRFVKSLVTGPGLPSPEPVLSIRSCSGCGYPSGRRIAAFTTENIAVFAPIPSAIVSTAIDVNPGLLRSVRQA